MREGDLLTTIKEMKFDDIPNDVKVYADRYKNEFQSSAGYKAGKDMDNFTPSKRPNPANATDFENQVKADPKLESRLNQILKDLESKISNNNLNVGKWLKRTIFVVVGSLGLAWLYEKVKEHQQLLNGCWLINLLGPADKVERCKVYTLCCDDVDTTSEEVAQYMCSSQALNKCGGSLQTPCFPEDECIQYDVDNNCIQKLTPRCAEGTCHKACSETANLVEVPPNHRLSCVQLNFWDSVEEFVDDVIDEGKQQIEWIMKIVLMGLAIIFIYNLLQKIFLSFDQFVNLRVNYIS
jgi:hypothetical protein